MKKRILSLLLIVGIISLAACSSGDSDALVETSAGNVTKDELYEVMKDRYGEQVLQELVFEKILAAKYKVSDDEINFTLDQLRIQYGESLDAQYTKEELTRLATFQVLQEKAVTNDITVSEDEMQEHYAELLPEVNAKHILVADEALAIDLKKQLDDGADFGELATENSTDPGSAEAGGNLGWFNPAQMVPEFSDALLKLTANEISEPVQSQHGWHIIQLLEKGEKEAFEDMKSEIEHTLKLAKVDQELIQKSMERELNEAKVTVKDSFFEGLFGQFDSTPEE